jgi:aminocarboxymuconate-semialdehyde decarboxylase
LASSIGRPADNCLSLARLIVRGIFEQFPTLKLVGSHLGGGICEVIGRMDYAYELQDFCFFLGSYEPMLIKHPPSHYLKMMHFDSASYTPLAAEMCLKTIGEDRFLFGTDSPPLIPLKLPALKMMDQIGMTPAQREKVMGGNAARLLKLNLASARRLWWHRSGRLQNRHRRDRCWRNARDSACLPAVATGLHPDRMSSFRLCNGLGSRIAPAGAC